MTREDEKMLIRFGGLGDEELVSVPLRYVGAEDEEAAELMPLAQLQRIGCRVLIGSGAFGRAPEVSLCTSRGRGYATPGLSVTA